MKKLKSAIATLVAVLVMGFCANAQVAPKDTTHKSKPHTNTLHKKTTPAKPSNNKPSKTMDTVYRAPKPGQAPPKK